VATVTGFSRIGPRDHVVHFYHSEEELVTRAGGYLAGAIRGGGVVIVIASEKHRLAFEKHLADAGIDVSAARASGTWLVVDAEEALSQFTADGKPDPGGFDTVIGKLVRQAARSGGQARAYGEMVALLWEAGLLTAAIELEDMWNDLIRKERFTLLCAYPAGSVAGEEHATALAEVCRLHTAVVGEASDGYGEPDQAAAAQPVQSAERAWTFPAALESTRAARHVLAGALPESRSPSLSDDAALVVSELATNAVVHARSEFTVTLTVSEDMIRISVHDTMPLPAGAEASTTLPASALHGLGAVAALAVRWGAEPAGNGKDVWAELSR
jgi:hypothetical protein